MHAGQVVLAVLIIAPFAVLLAGTVARARASRGRARARGGSAGLGGFLQRRHERRLEQQRHENGMRRDRFRSALRMREQAERERRAEARADRRRGAAVPGEATWTDPGGAPRPDGDGPRRRAYRPSFIRLRPERVTDGPPPGSGPPPPPPAPPGAGPVPAGSGGSGDGPSRPDAPDRSPRPAAPRPGPPPQSPQPPARGGQPAPPGAAPSRPAPGQSPAPTLEGVIVTGDMTTGGSAVAVPGVEQVIEGSAALRRHGMAGNAQAKRRAVLGNAAAIDVLAGNVRALAQAMAEPDQHYGPEVTEPMTGAAAHLTAASTVLYELDGRLRAIIRAMEELAASGVQPPHHEQMAAQ